MAMEPRAGAQRQFEQRDIQCRAFNVCDAGRRRAGWRFAPDHCIDPFIEQRVDAETFRVHAKLDEQSDNLRRHALDPRRFLRERPLTGMDLDVEAKLPPANAASKPTGPEPSTIKGLGRPIGGQATGSPGGSIGANRASAGVLKTTRKFWLATASALATMPSAPTMAMRAVLISLAPRKRPFL